MKNLLKSILKIFGFNFKSNKLNYLNKSDKELLNEDFKALNQDFQIAKENLLSKYK